MATTSTKNSAEEVIEKKETSPVAMAALVISMIAILGAIALQLMEIAEYRTNLSGQLAAAENPAENQLKADRKAFEDAVKKVINDNPGSTLGTEGGTAPPPEEGGGAKAAQPTEEEKEPAQAPAEGPGGAKKPAPNAPAEPEKPAAETKAEPAAAEPAAAEPAAAEEGGAAEEPIFDTNTAEEPKK